MKRNENNMKRNRTPITIQNLKLIKINDNGDINVHSNLATDQLLTEAILHGFNRIFNKIGNGITLKISQSDTSYIIKGTTQIEFENKELSEPYKNNVNVLFEKLKDEFYNQNSFSELLNRFNKLNNNFDGITFSFSIFNHKIELKIYNKLWKSDDSNRMEEYYKFIGKSSKNTPIDYEFEYNQLKEDENKVSI